MELGLCLDDDLFEKKDVKKTNFTQQQPYNVKVCEKGWPFECHSPCDAVQRQNISKFQADYWYGNGQYDKALQAYTSIHKNPQVISTTVERDITESVIRCHIKLDNFEAALELLIDLVKKQGEDTSLLLLLAKICSANNHIQSEIVCYKRCILLHSYNHNFWYSLALAYKKVDKSLSKQESSKNNYLSQLIKVLLQLTMTPKLRDSVKLSLKCIHCKCLQKQVFLDKELLSIEEQYNQDTHNGSMEVNNLLSELKEMENTEITNLSGNVNTKSCFESSQDSADEQPCVTVGMHSEESVDKKLCDFSIAFQQSSSKVHQSREFILSADKCNAMSLFSFFCLLRTRFLLQRAIWTSSSFVKEKLTETMSEVKEQINHCVLCQCGELKKCILKQIELDDVNLIGQQIHDLDMHSLYQASGKKHWM